MTTPLADVAAALNRQWDLLERWLEPLGDDLLGTADQPSSLPGWTNGELLAHLGRAMSAVTAAMPCPPGSRPLSLAEYLGTYPGRAQEITDTTRDLAHEIAATPQATVREMAHDALEHLEALGDDGDRVVQARRAPLRRAHAPRLQARLLARPVQACPAAWLASDGAGDGRSGMTAYPWCRSHVGHAARRRQAQE